MRLLHFVLTVGCSACAEPTVPAAEPAPSASHSMVYHDGLSAVLLVNTGLGGMSTPPSSTKTVLWRWTGSDWLVQDANGPPIRNLAGVAYDAKRNVLVMYGGSYDETKVYDETWEWRVNGGWSMVAVTGPGKRDHTQMVYDAARERVVLVGGQVGTGVFPSPTWTFDGVSWQQFAAGGPGGRIHHGLVYDAVGQRVLAFGGITSSGDAGDTWAWTGTAWSAAAPSITPRSHASLARTSRGIVLMGGFPANSPLLLLENSAWRTDAQANAPTGRYLAAYAYDSKRNVTVLFGGGNAATDDLYADTWEFSESTGWRKIR